MSKFLRLVKCAYRYRDPRSNRQLLFGTRRPEKRKDQYVVGRYGTPQVAQGQAGDAQ
jgi:hypothetical protein